MGEALEIGITLFAIATLEGVRRAGRGVLILQLIAFRGWRFGGTIPLGRGYLLISPLLPLIVPVVLDRGQAAYDAGLPNKRLLTRFKARRRRAQIGLLVLRAYGILGLVMLVVYLPHATVHRGSFGLLSALAAIMAVACAQLPLAWSLLRRLGLGREESLRRIAKLLNPFAIGRAAEVVAARIVEGAPALGVAITLLGRAEAVRQLRPILYDVVYGDTTPEERELLEHMAPITEWRTLLQSAESDEGTATCPRCGAQFAESIVECTDCDAVALVVGRDEAATR